MGKLRITHKYDDIIHRAHPVSDRRPGMRIGDRAAQFAPFAALTGYEAVIEETARRTEQEILNIMKDMGFSEDATPQLPRTETSPQSTP